MLNFIRKNKDFIYLQIGSYIEIMYLITFSRGLNGLNKGAPVLLGNLPLYAMHRPGGKLLHFR